jgi:hypothetical protein
MFSYVNTADLLSDVTTVHNVGSIPIMWSHNGEVCPHVWY